MNFDSIFTQYYTLYRGQATNLPAAGSNEYIIAMRNANTAILKWDRTDGVLWRELITTFQAEYPATGVVATNTHAYNVANMRKPPSRVVLVGGTAQTAYLDVIDPQDIKNFTSMNGIAYFTGSAQKGYVLHMDGDLSNSNGALIDFVYVKKPTLFTTGTDVTEMSDPTFIIQDMLASRAANSRNGFLYKTAKAEATTALQNMKLENSSGMYGAPPLLGGLPSNSGWGVRSNATDI